MLHSGGEGRGSGGRCHQLLVARELSRGPSELREQTMWMIEEDTLALGPIVCSSYLRNMTYRGSAGP